MSNGAKDVAQGLAPAPEHVLRDFLVQGLKSVALDSAGRLGHPMASAPGDSKAWSRFLGAWGSAAGAINGLLNIQSGELNNQIKGVLQLTGSGSGFGRMVADAATKVPASRVVNVLGAAGMLTSIAGYWWDAMAGGGAAIHEGVENARREGGQHGHMAGFAAGLVAMERGWVEAYGPIHATHSGVPSQDRAEDARIGAYQDSKLAGYVEAQRLSDAQALAIVSETLRYAQARGVYTFQTQDPWEGVVNLIERTLPMMANEMKAGTWDFQEAPPRPEDGGGVDAGEGAGAQSSGSPTGSGEAGQPVVQQEEQPGSAPTAGPGVLGGASSEVVVLGPESTFMSIARDTLWNAWNREPSAGEVAVYMTVVIAANMERLLNPATSQGFSGPVLVLPAPPADPTMSPAPAVGEDAGPPPSQGRGAAEEQPPEPGSMETGDSGGQSAESGGPDPDQAQPSPTEDATADTGTAPPGQGDDGAGGQGGVGDTQGGAPGDGSSAGSGSAAEGETVAPGPEDLQSGQAGAAPEGAASPRPVGDAQDNPAAHGQGADDQGAPTRSGTGTENTPESAGSRGEGTGAVREEGSGSQAPADRLADQDQGAAADQLADDTAAPSDGLADATESAEQQEQAQQDQAQEQAQQDQAQQMEQQRQQQQQQQQQAM